MSKFKVGDELRVTICPSYWEGDCCSPQRGDLVKVTSVDGKGVYIEGGGYAEDQHFTLVEDRSTWHPHHDVIVAWAKGAKVRGRHIDGPWTFALSSPEWRLDWEYEVIQEPDHTEEIAEIESKMRDLADRLEKLK